MQLLHVIRKVGSFALLSNDVWSVVLHATSRTCHTHVFGGKKRKKGVLLLTILHTAAFVYYTVTKETNITIFNIIFLKDGDFQNKNKRISTSVYVYMLVYLCCIQTCNIGNIVFILTLFINTSRILNITMLSNIFHNLIF